MKNLRLPRLTLAACGLLFLSGCGLVVDSVSSRQGDEGPRTPPGSGPAGPVPPALGVSAVPRADCGPGSQQETGIQGQIPQADRESGRAELGYWCNLELIGQHRHGEGASWQFAWYDDCGYYGTLFDQNRKTPQGTVVVNASDPGKPVETTTLTTPAMMDPHESLRVNERRGLLAAVDLGSDTDRNGTHEFFDIYDVTRDCAHPELRASVELGGTSGHEGNWAPDGRTYYGSDAVMAAIDVEDPANPQLFHLFTESSHGLTISDDGNRLYTSGLAILDISDIQKRSDIVTIREIGKLTTLYCSQHPLLFSRNGKPFVICAGELGREPGAIIDISDEANPKMASILELEVHLPQNSALIAPELMGADNSGQVGDFVAGPGVATGIGGVGGAAIVSYDGHYCSVDRQVDATIAACGYLWSGIRIFDIRDPWYPKEIAYWIPPAVVADEPLLGSSNQNGEIAPNVVDKCSAQIRVVRERGELWTQCQDNEFVVLRFTNGVWPFED